MAAELSKVLDHVDRVRELDLEGVAADLARRRPGRRDARRRTGPLPDRDVGAGGGPEPVDGGFGVPSPGRAANERAGRADRGRGGREARARGKSTPASCSRPTARGRPPTSSTPSPGWRGPPPPRRRGTPLGGVPLAVKDLFCTEGVPSQSGSKILEGYRPPYTATVVRAAREAGAPLLGKTNQDEFAMGSSNENSAFGPVLNPWDRRRVPGGSSGGSAAAVAAGLAPWAIGTDTGGSIRQPAALCGIVGLKPTYGACSRYGMIAFASSLDQAGPLTRDVTDAALLLSHMVGQTRCDSTSVAFPEPISLPRARRPQGRAAGRARGAARAPRARASNPACAPASSAALKLGREARRDASSRAGCRTPRTRCRPTT